MKKILVPIDFSPASRKASEYAAKLAKQLSAEIRLLYVFHEASAVIEGPVDSDAAGADLMDENEILVKKEINFLRENYAVEISGYARIGFKTAKIRDMADEMEADLIVMGAGETTLSTIRKVNIPVLIIPEEASLALVKHIVFAADFNEISNISCFDPLLTLMDKLDAMLQVLHVKRYMKETDIEDPGKEQLRSVFSKVTFWYEEIEADSVEEGIQDFTASHPAELLVMVARTHNVFERAFGSVHTSSMIYKTKLPLLVLQDK
jgi:nucleotide-binding universal stress UspA family protein